MSLNTSEALKKVLKLVTKQRSLLGEYRDTSRKKYYYLMYSIKIKQFTESSWKSLHNTFMKYLNGILKKHST